MPEALRVTAGHDDFTFLDAALSVPTRFGTPYSPSHGPGLLGAGAAGEDIERAAGLLSEPFGPSTTFTGFEPSKRTPDEDRIDFIMLGDNGALIDETEVALRTVTGGAKWRMKTYGAIPNWSEGDAGSQVSDHRAIMTRIKKQ